MQNNFNISIFAFETENIMRKRFSFNKILLVFAMLALATQGFGEGLEREKDETRVSVVVIDPGHGGKDHGASVGSANEKDIVLDLAKKLGSTIQRNFPDIKIIYTRTTDVFIPLHERANIANRNDADLFISIHINAVEQTHVQGTETFVLGQHRSKDNLEVAKKENAVILLEDNYNTTYEGFDPNLPESYIMFELVQDEYLEQSVMLASDIQNQFRNSAKRIDRSVKQAGFLVLRRTTMPSVLVEAGFLSNAAERKYMLSEAGKTNLSMAIFSAFEAYKKRIESKSSFNLNAGEIAVKAAPASEPSTAGAPKVLPANTYFTVQVAASSKKLDPTPPNFKGEKSIFRKDYPNISRYYSGKFKTHESALAEMDRLQNNFPGAFVVAFENEEVISVKKALRKM